MKIVCTFDICANLLIVFTALRSELGNTSKVCSHLWSLIERRNRRRSQLRITHACVAVCMSVGLSLCDSRVFLELLVCFAMLYTCLRACGPWFMSWGLSVPLGISGHLWAPNSVLGPCVCVAHSLLVCRLECQRVCPRTMPAEVTPMNLLERLYVMFFYVLRIFSFCNMCCSYNPDVLQIFGTIPWHGG